MALTIKDYNALLVLHRCVLAAKFDVEVGSVLKGSPVLAAVANDVVEALIAATMQATASGLEAWKSWREIGPSRLEWSAAIRHLADSPAWDSWSDEEQSRYIQVVFAPFSLESDAERLAKEQVARRRGAGSHAGRAGDAEMFERALLEVYYGKESDESAFDEDVIDRVLGFGNRSALEIYATKEFARGLDATQRDELTARIRDRVKARLNV